MKKVLSNSLTAGMFSKKFKARVKELIARDNAIRFMDSVKCTPYHYCMAPGRFHFPRC